MNKTQNPTEMEKRVHLPESLQYRYSDADLAEFRQVIHKKREEAREVLLYHKNVLARVDNGGTEDTENKYQSSEDGQACLEREQMFSVVARQEALIQNLELALIRIENKTYGICRQTGKLIDKARLKAVPHATLSIEAKNAESNKVRRN